MNNQVIISFLGDISLNGVYEAMCLNGEKPFSIVSDILQDRIVVGNLECFARGVNGVNELKKPRLETSIKTLNYLKDFNLQIACLANNHVYDHLEDGFQKTTGFLDRNGIRSLGASLDSTVYKEPKIIDENGVKVGLLNYVTKDTNPNPPKGIKINLNWFELNSVIKAVKQLKDKVNHVVVMLHWGGRVEGGMYPDWDQPKIAKQLIDVGADLIIGHHSHTVQPFEIYKGKYIFYSLGNFCFSDFVFDGISHVMPKRRNYSMIVSTYFTKNEYVISTQYFANKEGVLIKSDAYSRIVDIRLFIYKYFIKYRLFWYMYYFNHLKVMPIIFYLQRRDMTFAQKMKRLSFKKLRNFLIKK